MSDGGFQPGPVRRPIGLETEFGVLRPDDPYANPVVLSSQVVEAYRTAADVPAVRWDYEGEDPLADLRGGRIQRSAALARRIRTLTDGVGRRADRRVAELGTAAPGVGRPGPGPPGHPDP